MAGRGRQAMAWFAASVIVCPAVVVTIWALPIALALPIACAVDTYRVAAATPQPLRLFTPWVGVIVGCGIAYAIVLQAFVVEAYRIPSSSMHPTLQIGDRFLVDKISLRWRPIERGELIAFNHPCTSSTTYTKRVVAVGGDTVEIRCNVLYVNGSAIPEKLVRASCEYQDHDDHTNTWFDRKCSRYHVDQSGRTYDVLHDPERPGRDAALATLSEGDSRDFPQSTEPPSCLHSESGSPNAKLVLGRIEQTKASIGATPCEP